MLARTDVRLATRPDDVAALFRESDSLIARAIRLLQRGGIEATTGLSVEMLLQSQARMTPTDALMATQAAGVLTRMPATQAAFDRGLLSWGQVRSIVCAVRGLRVSILSRIDELVGVQAPALAHAETDRIVAMVDREVERARPSATRREQRHIDRGFFSMQSRLDGSASFYGEADAESSAVIAEALDAFAARPHRSDSVDRPSRAQQHLDALVGICESALAGGTTELSARPRPRLLAYVEQDEAQLFWNLRGRTPRLTKVATEALSCDATVIPVVFRSGDPVEVGDASHEFSDKVRDAIIARDGGCRFPGCEAPVGWCDVHHLVPGRGNRVEDGVLQCRRCHRRVHRFRWSISNLGNGLFEFSRGGRRLKSTPRHRAPPPGG